MSLSTGAPRHVLPAMSRQQRRPLEGVGRTSVFVGFAIQSSTLRLSGFRNFCKRGRGKLAAELQTKTSNKKRRRNLWRKRFVLFHSKIHCHVIHTLLLRDQLRINCKCFKFSVLTNRCRRERKAGRVDTTPSDSYRDAVLIHLYRDPAPNTLYNDTANTPTEARCTWATLDVSQI